MRNLWRTIVLACFLGVAMPFCVRAEAWPDNGCDDGMLELPPWFGWAMSAFPRGSEELQHADRLPNDSEGRLVLADPKRQDALVQRIALGTNRVASGAVPGLGIVPADQSLAQIAGVPIEGKPSEILETTAEWWRQNRAAYYGLGPKDRSGALLGTFVNFLGDQAGGCTGAGGDGFATPLAEELRVRQSASWLPEKLRSTARWYGGARSVDEVLPLAAIFAVHGHRLLTMRQYDQAEYFVVQAGNGIDLALRTMPEAAASRAAVIAGLEARLGETRKYVNAIQRVIVRCKTACDSARDALRRQRPAEALAHVTDVLGYRDYLKEVDREDLVRDIDALSNEANIGATLTTLTAAVVEAERLQAANDTARAAQAANRALDQLRKEWSSLLRAGKLPEASALVHRARAVVERSGAKR